MRFAPEARKALDSQPATDPTDDAVRLTPVDDKNMGTMARIMLLRHLKGTQLMYRDTVPKHVKQARRRRNKVAKASRKMNRQ